ncbi:PLP-dependent aminotransferase family protein [Pseudomonas oryzihabitans]|uniref:MocR-like pyridoxine biosynthesis transcription factor PdxR n=1 Tax=Pseudomonas oryzihabitans TaxID=47885 RepID=UPI0011A819CE|nr:PLP-dependent aminotransferase family protein [Pseudomonas psychrotolerans]
MLEFDPSGLVLKPGQGLARQLYLGLRERILGGELAAGVRLPASRELARLLGLSRNTVTAAYDQLLAEGFLDSRPGDGTYIAPVAQALAGPAAATRTAPPSPASVPPGAPCAFRVGLPAMDLFPFATWARLQQRFWRQPEPALLGYREPGGEPRLRRLLCAYLRQARGLVCTPEQILITSGAQQAIELCARLLLAPGALVAMEDPGYRAAGLALQSGGARLQGVPVDAAGLQVERLADQPDCRLVYVTPSHQYPTGAVLSLPRRLALLDWARQADGWIVEDDYDGEYRYQGAPLAPLAALDRHGRVLYVGTFSKIAFPGLRLGYLVAPPALVPELLALQRAGIRHLDSATQTVMADFIEQGHFQRHIRRMRRAARSRRDALLAGWPQVAGCAAPGVPVAGLHLCLPVSGLAREAELVAQAAAVGVELNPLSRYWLPGGPTPPDARAGLVLGFAAVPEARIVEALARLREAWA